MFDLPVLMNMDAALAGESFPYRWSEDDGWLMSYVYDSAGNLSEVVILAAQDFSGGPIARIQLPQRVPYGFHGNRVPYQASDWVPE